MTKFVTYGQIVEENGKTIRENNLEKKHKYALGTLVTVTHKIYGAGDPEERPADAYIPPLPPGGATVRDRAAPRL